MKVEDVMTKEVLTVAPETTLKAVAALLARARIAGVPVCDPDGRVVGVVSEADILWKETGLLEEPAGVIDRIFGAASGDLERVTAATAAEAMTSPAITIAPRTSAAEAARLMVARRINRLPVVDGGRLVGIVARADLVRAFIRTDAQIADEIEEDVLLHTLWVDPDTVSVAVEDGRVALSGQVENQTVARLVESYVRRVPGVVAVHSTLRWQVDDRSRPATTPTTYNDGLVTF